MKEIELKPCPFCGGTVRLALCGDDFDSWYIVTRGSGKNPCKCRLFMESDKFSGKGEEEKSDLIDAWNKRSNGGKGR